MFFQAREVIAKWSRCDNWEVWSVCVVFGVSVPLDDFSSPVKDAPREVILPPDP